MSRVKYFWSLGLVALVIILSVPFYSTAAAQEDQPYYIVQEGDSLWEIAARFGVPIEELQQANNITDPSQVAIEPASFFQV